MGPASELVAMHSLENDQEEVIMRRSAPEGLVTRHGLLKFTTVAGLENHSLPGAC